MTSTERAAIIEECARVATIYAFSARQAVRSAKGPSERRSALAVESALEAVVLSIRALLDASVSPAQARIDVDRERKALADHEKVHPHPDGFINDYD